MFPRFTWGPSSRGFVFPCFRCPGVPEWDSLFSCYDAGAACAVLTVEVVVAAADPKDTRTMNLGDDEKDWTRKALEAQRKSLERARDKFSSGSAMYDAVTKDISSLDKLLEKFR